MEILQYSGLWFLIAVAFNMWAWMSVLGSGARLSSKMIWTIVLACLPAIGFVAWYVLGPRSARA
ncbi:MAG: PLDc_N domain-containing protein [Boseongicola sp.]|nr:PLDc_N domain-containing protein [Silicimonas sp.]NNF90674.1 PLDc_N domain-containing protein [Boseongicola sp.]